MVPDEETLDVNVLDSGSSPASSLMLGVLCAACLAALVVGFWRLYKVRNIRPFSFK